MLAAIVMRIATGALGQRVAQKPAGSGIARHDARFDELEVLAGVLFVPRRGARRQPLQPHRGAELVARDTAGVAVALGREDRLDARTEIVEVERRG
jgi:hypothetical protein